MGRHAFILTFFVCPLLSFGQDIKGGEMSYSLVSGLTCSFDVLLYSQTSLGISHDTIMFHAGTERLDTLLGVSTDLPNDVTEWQYTTTHTYASASTYVATVSDSFRVGGILAR